MSRIREVGANKKLHADFDSVPDVFRVIEKLNWKPNRDKSSDRKSSGDGSFHTFNSLNEAIDVMRNKPETLVQFNHNDEKLVREESPGKDVRYDVTGDYIDIDRYLEGVPDVFGNAVMGNPKNIFCTINILTSYVHWTDKDYLIQRQRRITRLVDWLEAQNVRCQIIGTLDSKVLNYSVIVKEFADPFDVNHLAVVCHPDWLRRIIFLIDEQSKTFQSGYGNSIEYDKRMLKYIPQPEDGLYVYAGGYIPYSEKYNEKTQKYDITAIDQLNAEFDRLEGQIEEMIASGLTYNDEPFVIAGETNTW